MSLGSGGDFAQYWARGAGVHAVAGDFNGDGKDDLALVGGPGWNTVPIAFSSGDGFFLNISNSVVPDFPQWAQSAGVRVLGGDFNGDHLADIALLGVSGWTTIPVAFSQGDGTFVRTNGAGGDFARYWAVPSQVQAVAGDFDGDHRTDIALVGGPSWTTVPIAHSLGGGSFNITNQTVYRLPQLALVSGVKAFAGDFDGDGLSDIALVAGQGSASIPIGISDPGTFDLEQRLLDTFPGWASYSRPLVGRFNSDNRSDVALLGWGWQSIPVAFRN